MSIASDNPTVADAELEANKAVIRQMIERVQGGGDFEYFEKVFAADYIDHTPFGGFPPDRNGTRSIYETFRQAFPDWHAVVHFQVAEGNLVTSHKTYHGTHRGAFMSAPATGRTISFGVVDVMRVRNGQITDHWGYADAIGLMNQLKSSN